MGPIRRDDVLTYQVFKIEDTRRRLAGAESLVQEFANFCLEDSPELAAEIEVACKTRDGKKLHSSAHALKGLVSNFGAEECERHARALELAGKNGNFEDAEKHLTRLRDELTKLQDDLRKYLAEES